MLVNKTIFTKLIAPVLFSLILFQLPAGEEKKITISFPPSIIEYNPLYTYSSTEAQLYTAIYEGLVSYDPYTLQPVPAVAEKWVTSPDKTEFIFTLRKNAYFWDGVNITSDTFRNSWLKILSPAGNAEYAFLLDVIAGAEDYRKGKNPDPSSVGITAADNYTLKVKLNTPAEHFLKILCHHSFVPVHPGFLDRKDWTGLSSAPGNGPYYILKKTEKSIYLAKNQIYWDEKNVEIPEIEILFIEDAEETTDLFNDGKVQWATGNFSSDSVANKNYIVFNPSFASNYFFFNCRQAPWNNENLRKALLLSAPVEAIRSKSFLFYPATSLVPPIPDYPQASAFKSQERDKAADYLQLAMQELDDEILRNGIVIKIPDSLESARVASLLKEAWEEFPGIEVRIQIFSYQTYYQELKKSDYALGTMSWIGDFPDPLTFLQMWTTGSNLNDSGYSNPGYDNDITESLSMSGKKRYEFLSLAEQKLLDSAVILPVSYTPSINLVNTNELSGWYPNPIDIHPMKFLKLRKGFIHPMLAKNEN